VLYNAQRDVCIQEEEGKLINERKTINKLMVFNGTPVYTLSR